ncbi:MAG: L,D-transpeptidase [Rhizobiales bacterium]|nr:L,D-transpeptidase [Hyphomicrobiales bacterium]
MARFVFVFLLLVGFSLGDIVTSKSASAGVVAKIDLSEQRMRVYVNGRIAHTWQISSGRGRFRTPTGNYNPYRMHRMWYSQRYNNAPMPFSVFYHRGYAILLYFGAHFVNLFAL